MVQIGRLAHKPFGCIELRGLSPWLAVASSGLQAGVRQDLDGNHDVHGAVGFVDHVLHEQRREACARLTLSGQGEVAPAFAELWVDAQAGVQFVDGVKDGAAEAPPMALSRRALNSMRTRSE